MDLKQLEQLVTVNPVEIDSIYEIIGRMKVLLDYFETESKYHNLLPFLRVYYLVTKTVNEESLAHRNYYKDYNKLEKLDIQFASLYFKPLKGYLLEDKLISPWKNTLSTVN